ncbi:hypothetical protein [uncultured Methanobrevibacter sp.]|uniref:hypothetical protein n=1 Tax=uncultured Methanobrevibacter sp. TaxID=253161 RepID=UPI0025EF885A|nr:hypothetical protein [uncultured Methanobrevibacter sp.]
MKLNQILIIIVSIFIIALAINAVNAAQIDSDASEVLTVSNNDDIISSADNDVYTSSGTTHTYKVKGKSVYIKDYNPKYKLSKKAKKQINSVKKAPKKTYKLIIDHDTYKDLRFAKKNKFSDFYTFDTNYKCKVLKPVLKSKTVKKTIVNKKYTNPQKYSRDYSRYFNKYSSDKYNMKVKFHYYKGTNTIKYATIKVTKKVKQTKIIKFKTVYTKVKAEIGYAAHNGQLSKGNHLFFIGNIFGYDFTHYVASKHNFSI